MADQYQARGYEAGDCDYRFTSYHALPDTVVLVAKAQERVVATFTLVTDNTLLGLPAIPARLIRGSWKRSAATS